MSQRYIAFDVETPNYANDRISAIGITVIESGAIAEEYAFLVNPETAFAPSTQPSPASLRKWSPNPHLSGALGNHWSHSGQRPAGGP